MSNIITKTTKFALYILSDYISKGDIVVDATAGNGNDTLELAKIVLTNEGKNKGKIFAFDIQAQALNRTKELLSENGYNAGFYSEIILDNNFNRCTGDKISSDCSNILLIKDCHSNMGNYFSVEDNISAIVFNLGYLPLADKTVTTNVNTTLVAVKEAIRIVKKDGLVSIIMYDGHQSGKEEKTEIMEFAKGLSSKEYHVAYINLINQKNNPPEILLITKK